MTAIGIPHIDRKRVYRHRTGYPVKALFTQVIVWPGDHDWHLHVKVNGSNQGSFRVSPAQGQQILDRLLPPQEREEVEDV